MAGIEQLEIHSKSYLVRWVNAKEGHTISWSIKPEKKSINFGIFKHPGSGQAPTPKLPSSTFEVPPTPGLTADEPQRDSSTSRNSQSTAIEKLKSFGLISIYWYGSCEANRVSTGQYDVPKGSGGTFALVFDNTFSKQISKKATFVLLTYPTDSPPQSNHHDHHVQGLPNESTSSLRDRSGNRVKLQHLDSTDSVKKAVGGHSDVTKSSDEFKHKRPTDLDNTSGANFFTGVLQKRRRKKHQGWARRFFSLNYTTATLSYYHDRNTQALRGTVPLSLAAIGANAKTRQISIDSGAEIWHLKAPNEKDFQAWKRALERARIPTDPASPALGQRLERRGRSFSAARPNLEEEREWSRVEALLTRIEQSRDAARAIAKDTDPKYLPLNTLKQVSSEKLDPLLKSGASSNSESPSEHSMSGYFNADGPSERRPFWKRKPSSDRPMPGMFRRSVSATPASTPQRSAPPTPGASVALSNPLQSHPEEGVHDQCMTLLRDLDAIATDFALLLKESKQRRTPNFAPTTSRMSMESQGSEEFFDAEGFDSSQLLAIEAESGDEDEASTHSGDDSGSASDYDEPLNIRKHRSSSIAGDKAFPNKPDSLSPLPVSKVKRRTTVPPSTMAPPSLIGFFRKNVGKDLSTVSMPVSANEPTSLVQRFAETLEYSKLLDLAATTTPDSLERLLHVTAFAVSTLSSSRAKERAVRKPFNPMLGETFEIVREDRGFRFLAEKVSHRPVRIACQADHPSWSLTQSPLPSQKFWGKSAEIVTEGKIRVILHSTKDRFSWNPPTTFLRNIIAGEKYVEPSGTMTVVNETTRESAIVTFKAKGMFSGRLEDVIAQLYDSHGEESNLGINGKWTNSLNVTEHGCARANSSPIWSVGELVPESNKRYGFTTFAASLNEITSIEGGKLPPTDSRLRPDQRAAEDGQLDRAENLKAKLEEAQRARRKVMEEKGEDWQAKWFRRLEPSDGTGEEVWVAKTGGESYWEKRKQGDWKGIVNIFET